MDNTFTQHALLKGSDGLMYVGSYLATQITVHKQQQDNTLALLETINTGMLLPKLGWDLFNRSKLA